MLLPALFGFATHQLGFLAQIGIPTVADAEGELQSVPKT